MMRCLCVVLLVIMSLSLLPLVAVAEDPPPVDEPDGEETPIAAEPASAAIVIVVEEGVPEAVIADFQAAGDAVIGWVKNGYGLDLKKDARVLLVPSAEAFAAALIRELKVSKTEAERRARVNRAWSGDPIIINVGRVGNKSDRIYLLSHEVVHVYQRQLCPGNKCFELTWIREAAADIIAARVTESVGSTTFERRREDWAKTVSNAPAVPGVPKLTELHSAKNWADALDKYGTNLVYRTADIAGLKLLDLAGDGALLGFFEKLNESDVATAFAESFGVPLRTFEAEFKPR